jgi:hypothetical protein
MLSTEYNFLFIHVPKTGGNSIQSVLADYSDDEIVTPFENQDGVERFEVRHPKYSYTKHATLSDYRRVLPRNVYEDLYKFSVLRNPWDRVVSLYFSPHRGVDEWDREGFIRLVEEMKGTRRFVRERTLYDKISKWIAFLPKSKRGPLDEDVDAILRFENLREDFRRVCDKLGIPANDLPRRNQSERNGYVEYYDEELKQLVEQRFGDEIRYGDYEFGAE